jgi:tetratricopeptide (TPR) repeat protein
MFFDPDGSEVDWILGYDPPADAFQARIEKILKSEGTFKSLNAAYAKDPKSVSTIFGLARKWSDRYNVEKAAELYKQVLAFDPDGKAGTTDYNGTKVSYTQYAEYQIGLSALQVRQGKSDPALLLAFVKKYPEGTMVKEAYIRMAMAYYGRGASEAEAAKFFEEYTGRYPKDFMANNSWVRRILQDREPLDQGIALALKGVDLAQGPSKTAAYQSLAQMYLAKGDKAKAAETAEAMIKAEEERKKGAVSGEAMVAMPATGGAGPTIGAGASTYLLNAARIFVDADQKNRALAVFGPEFLKGHMSEAGTLRGYVAFWSGQSMNLDSALLAAKKTVELAPDGYREWSALSQVQLKLKAYDAALQSAEKALALAPAQPPMFKDNIKKSIDRIKEAMAEKK